MPRSIPPGAWARPWTPDARPCTGLGAGGWAAISLTADRAAVATAAELLGLADRMIAHDRRLRQGAPPVRPAHRELPGRQAPAGRGPGQARVRPAGGLRRRLGPRRGRARPHRPASTAKARPRTRPPRRPGSPSRCTGPSATPGSATSTSSSSGRGPWRAAWGSAADHRQRGARLADWPIARSADRSALPEPIGTPGPRDWLAGLPERLRERRRRRWACRCTAGRLGRQVGPLMTTASDPDGAGPGIALDGDDGTVRPHLHRPVPTCSEVAVD